MRRGDRAAYRPGMAAGGRVPEPQITVPEEREMHGKPNSARAARRVLSVMAGTVAVVLLATMAPADASVTIDEFGTNFSNGDPTGITVGPDGNVWFTEVQGGGDGLATITPNRTGVPTLANDFTAVTGLPVANVATGQDGNLWFTVEGTRSPIGEDEVGAMTPTGTVIGVWPLDDPSNGVPPDIALGPDGNMWVTEDSTSQIAQVTPSGVITQFATGECVNFDVQPLGIAAGPDGNLWYTVANPHCDEIGRISTSGTSTMFPLPHQASTVIFNDVTAGPDGNMWFAGTGIGNINPTTGTVTIAGYQHPATSIAPSPCANDLWFTSGTGSVGKVTTSGTESLFSLPTANSAPDDVTAAPNGTVFVTETTGGGGQIARVVDSAALLPCVILLANFRFNVTLVTLHHQGMKVHWMSQAPGTHGVADASGMNLFGFSASSGLPTPVPIGTTVSFEFDWAGTFPYDDPFDAAAPGGQVKVPIKVAPLVGAPGAQVTWASNDPPAGFGFDVQLKPPGGRDWITWQSGVAGGSAPFGPNDPLWAGPGKYQFRSRLRQLTSNAASGFSTAKSITIS
jgi:streptogramin lyase